MKVVFDPSFSSANHYVNMIVEGLKEKGIKIKSLGDAVRAPFFFITSKYVHLNWFEGLQGDNSVKLFILFLKQFCKLIFLKCFFKKIVWTMHNKVSHDSKASHYSRILTWLLIKLSSKIVIHSNISRSILIDEYGVKEHKIFYIPHPNYNSIYGSNKKTHIQKSNENRLKILFFGAVKQYKNIELIIKAARDLSNLDIEFSIFGNPNNANYADSLICLTEDLGNVNLNLKYIEDSVLVKEICNHDIVVLPYAKSSSLNSGSIFLAFSLKKTVICPDIGSIIDVKRDVSVFSYDYNSETEHYDKLKEQIEIVYGKWILDKNLLNKFGEEAYRYVSINNNIDGIVDEYMKLYNS